MTSVFACPSLRRFARGCSHSSSSSSSSAPGRGRVLLSDAPPCDRLGALSLVDSDADGGEELLPDGAVTRDLVEAGIMCSVREEISMLLLAVASGLTVDCVRDSVAGNGLLLLLLLLPASANRLDCDRGGGGLLGRDDTSLSIRKDSRTDMNGTSASGASSLSLGFAIGSGRNGRCGWKRGRRSAELLNEGSDTGDKDSIDSLTSCGKVVAIVDRDMSCSSGVGRGGGRTGVYCGAAVRRVEVEGEVKSMSEKSENAVKIQGEEARERRRRVKCDC